MSRDWLVPQGNLLPLDVLHESLLPLSMALKSLLKVNMALGRCGRDKEESSDGARTAGSGPGFDAGYAFREQSSPLWALVFPPGHLEQMTSKAPPR